MARYQYFILSRPKPGREAEFEDWYDNVHLGDVCKVDGVVGATRYRIDHTVFGAQLPSPGWTCLAIYEVESDNPKAVMDAISAAAKTPAMFVSDAIDTSNIAQLMAHKVAEA